MRQALGLQTGRALEHQFNALGLPVSMLASMQIGMDSRFSSVYDMKMGIRRGISESLARIAFVGLLVAGGWLLLQFYTEQEIVAAAEQFWGWWSTLFTGELARYWNPYGAGAVLFLAVSFVLKPITRLFRRRHGGSYDSNYSDSVDLD